MLLLLIHTPSGHFKLTFWLVSAGKLSLSERCGGRSRTNQAGEMQWPRHCELPEITPVLCTRPNSDDTQSNITWSENVVNFGVSVFVVAEWTVCSQQSAVTTVSANSRTNSDQLNGLKSWFA